MSDVHKGRGDGSHSGRAQRVAGCLPIIGVVGSYRRAWLMRDVVAAVTVCAVLVPQALAYGQLAGLSPVVGLYAALAPLVLYPLFASSRRLMVGPESGLAILTAVALAPLAAEGSAKFAVLAAMAALLTGAVLILAAVLRLGFLADFFSRPVLLGFLNGVAVIIIVSQLPKLFGISVHTDSTLGTLWQVITHLGDAQWRTIVLGVVLLAVLVLLGRFARLVPGALVVLVIGGALVSWLGLASKGVAIIGEVPAGLPGVSVPRVSLGDIGTLVPIAAGLAFVGFAESILTARAFAERHGEQVDANRELVALGTGNLGAGLLQGFPSSSSQSRTAIAETARMQTQLAQIGAGLLVVVFLLWLTGVLHDVPTVALAAIVIYAAASLFEVGALRRLYHQDRSRVPRRDRHVRGGRRARHGGRDSPRGVPLARACDRAALATPRRGYRRGRGRRGISRAGRRPSVGGRRRESSSTGSTRRCSSPTLTTSSSTPSKRSIRRRHTASCSTSKASRPST